MKEETKISDASVLSIGELKAYLKKYLKLDIQSKKVNPQDSIFQYQIKLKLGDEEISKVSFTA